MVSEQTTRRGGRRDTTGGGMGRLGGSAEGPGGECLCLNCGHREPHEIGDPCMHKKCPKCGVTMTRA